MRNIAKTQKQTISPAGQAMEAGETLSEIAEATADLPPKDRGLTPMSLLKMGFHYHPNLIPSSGLGS
jgi:hypothetical protein